jgi:hypothetical protein
VSLTDVPFSTAATIRSRNAKSYPAAPTLFILLL